MSSKPDPKTKLAQLDQDDDGRLPFILTWAEVKLLGIAGVSSRFLVQHAIITHPCSQGRFLLGWCVLVISLL